MRVKSDKHQELLQVLVDAISDDVMERVRREMLEWLTTGKVPPLLVDREAGR
jgi:hypothetical protein